MDDDADDSYLRQLQVEGICQEAVEEVDGIQAMIIEVAIQGEGSEVDEVVAKELAEERLRFIATKGWKP